MKRTLICFSIALLGWVGCKKNSDANPIPSQHNELPDCRLLTMSHENDFRSYNYEYDTAGFLVRENEYWSGSLRKWTILRYENERLVAREHWRDYPSQSVDLASFDTLIYNDLGQVIERQVFHELGGPSPHLVYSYEYDSGGLPVKCRLFYPAENEFWFSYQYIWTDGNITKINDFGGDFEGLMHEWFYEYGEALNYQKQLAKYPEYPEYQSVNMVSKMEAKDYTGLLDLICNPCQHEYVLNGEGLPKVIKYQWDEGEAYLEWDCD